MQTLPEEVPACPLTSTILAYYVKVIVADFLDEYDKHFDQELRKRNEITHHEPFDDLCIDKVRLTHMISKADYFKDKGWEEEHLYAYRKTSKEWAARVKRRSLVMRRFVDAVAQAILNHAEFLSSDLKA